jgi:hypothetical protein
MSGKMCFCHKYETENAAEGSAPIAIRWGSTQIGVWDPVALEIIL